jgi:DNA-directed RNA polymerase subunit N (RpoN/RPB10)
MNITDRRAKSNRPMTKIVRLPVRCFQCGAEEGEPCATASGKTLSKPHQIRWRLYSTKVAST